MAKVRLENIGKRWKGTEGISEINFDIPDGEFWVLVGPSGCGKSTILRMIAGLETPCEGNIYIGDRLVNQVPARQRDVAMVFQNYALYPHMTVAENLAFGLIMRNATEQTIRDRIKIVSKSLAIEHLLQRKPAQLSGGQQQRVALGRAMARSPQVFLFDEPLSNLDTQLRDDTRAELKLLHQQLQTTTIYVTHDQTEAMTLGDRLVVLDQGKISQIGTPLEIYQNPQNLMVASFLGSPAINILPVIYQAERLILGSQSCPCPSDWQCFPNQTYFIGIRPEHICLATEVNESSSEFTAQIRLDLRVLVTEILGSEILVRGAIENGLDSNRDSAIQFKIPSFEPGKSIKNGEKIKIEFDSQYLLLFSAAGDRLST